MKQTKREKEALRERMRALREYRKGRLQQVRWAEYKRKWRLERKLGEIEWG
jgi:hypothetical protein